ncbi:MAG: hypothetical protein K2X87_17660 [Gemmataceae bacterium]|nr:hypothetical protein [Gemmataceae bacterium]
MPLANELLLAALAGFGVALPVFVARAVLATNPAARPTVRELDFAALDRRTAEFLRTRAEALIPLGFDEPTLVDLPDHVSGIDVYGVLLANRRTGEKASVRVHLGRAGPAVSRVSVVEFGTWYDTGEKVRTANAADDPAYPPAPGDLRTTLPSVDDPAELLAVHRVLAERHRPGGRPVLYPPGAGAEHLTDRLAEVGPDLARQGYMRYDRAGDCYRPTLRGACRVAWAALPPGRQVRRLALRRRERKLLAEWREARPAAG